MIAVLMITMIFCHIVDDFYLQGILAKLKQKSWWEENYPDEKYEGDYVVALIEHSFSWAFMVMLPILGHMFWVGNVNGDFYFFAVMVNMIIHSHVDNLKANELKIGLMVDQICHVVQIVMTLFFYTVFCSAGWEVIH